LEDKIISLNESPERTQALLADEGTMERDAIKRLQEIEGDEPAYADLGRSKGLAEQEHKIEESFIADVENGVYDSGSSYISHWSACAISFLEIFLMLMYFRQ